MGIQFALAKAIGGLSTWGLKHVARRPAASLPGKLALKVDPQVIADLRSRCRQGSVITVGTNGKTSTNNLIADAFEADGRSIICNRTGANLAYGVASALLQSPGAEWGIIECDELWLAKVLPQLRSNYVVLLNLFRDQLDRCGEIDRIQSSIMGALESSPETTLIYNADDPLCAIIADAVDNPSIAFGLADSMGLAQNTVADAQMCQKCEGMVQYRFRQYGQLGDYFCEQCGFERPALDFAASHVDLQVDGVTFQATNAQTGETVQLHSPQGTPYQVYNLMAAYALMCQVGISAPVFQKAVDAFDPRNGRLQAYELAGRRVLLNLAKNPTGFNQNLKIIEKDAGPKAVAFFINDRVVDGHDISWIWDIDFEELASQRETVVFAGGERAHDLRVRLKYAGIDAQVITGIEEVFGQLPTLIAAGKLPADAAVYAIANYTALPYVHDALDKMEAAQKAGTLKPITASAAGQPASQAPAEEAAPATALSDQPPVVIAHLFPDLLNLYGDGGNVRILEQRLRWRGIPVEVRRSSHGDSVDLEGVDLVFLGGGPDREQKLASEALMAARDLLHTYVEEGGALLAICGGYQLLGHRWLLGEEEVPGLGIVDIETRRPGTSADRLIDNIVLSSPIASHPVVGYENHAGRTYLGEGVEPFGKLISSTGHGNNDTSQADGVLYKNVVGTYSHGPALSKNPEVADWLLTRALESWGRRTGQTPPALTPLNDQAELEANQVMATRLGVKEL